MVSPHLVSAQVRVEIRPAFEGDEKDKFLAPVRTFRIYLRKTKKLLGGEKVEIAGIESLSKFDRPSRKLVPVDDMPRMVQSPKGFVYPDAPEDGIAAAAKRIILEELERTYGIKAEWPQ